MMWRRILAGVAAFVCLLWLGLMLAPIREAFAQVLQRFELYRIAAGVTMPVSGSVAVTGIANPLPVSGTVSVTGFANPMPVSGTVSVTGFANPMPVSGTVAVTEAYAPKAPTCALGTAPTCMDVTDAEDEISLPASADHLYLIDARVIDGAANADAVDCISGATPEAVYGTTGWPLSYPFKGHLPIQEDKLSCDAPTGKTLRVCATSCTR